MTAHLRSGTCGGESVYGAVGLNWVMYEVKATKKNWLKVMSSPLCGAVLIRASRAKTLLQHPPKISVVMLSVLTRVVMVVDEGRVPVFFVNWWSCGCRCG